MRLPLFITACLLLIAGCRSGQSTEQFEHAFIPSGPRVERNDIIKEIKSDQDMWSVKTLSTGRKDYLFSIQAFRDRIYVAGGSFYKLSNEKITRVSKFNIPGNAWVSSVLFTDETIGFVTVIEHEKRDDQHFYRSRILSTVDGARSWSDVYKTENAVLNKLVRDGSGIIWAAGGRNPESKTAAEMPLLLTRDNTGAWNEVSASGFKGIIDYISIGERDRTLLLDEKGQIVELNAGINPILNENIANWIEPSASIRDVLQVGNRATIFSALGGYKHGMRTTVFTTEGSGRQWKSYALRALNIGKVISADNGDLFAGGSEYNQGGTGPIPITKAVILHSKDGGENWSFIYRSRKGSIINDLSLADDGTLWACGHGGTIVGLRKKGQ